MISCIIIEDQPLAKRILEKYIDEVADLNLLKTFTDAIEAENFLRNQLVDLVFLDIHLPKRSGLDFLKSQSKNFQVILTTAFPDYALESYNFNVVDYLLKPYTFERFNQAIQKLNNTKASLPAREDLIIIKSGHEFVQIATAEIIFIKSDGDYTEIVTAEKTYLSKDPLRKWLKDLDACDFCQVHRSFIINCIHFNRIASNTIYLGKFKVPVGRVYKKNFIDNYLN